MLGHFLFVVAELGLLDIDLVLQRELAFGIERPDRPADSRQRRDHAGQKLPVKLLRRNARLRQTRNLAHERANLPFGPLNIACVESRLFK